MKKTFFSFLILLSSSMCAEKFLIDRGEAALFTEEGPVIITKSDVERFDLEGNAQTVDDVIFEQRMFQETKKYKIEVDDAEVDRYLEAIQREHGISLDQLRAMFNASGRTYEEGREQMKILYANNKLMDFKVRSRLIVPEAAVREYYDANPVMQEAKYLLKRTVIPFDTSVEKDVQSARIKKQIEIGGNIIGAVWGDAFWYDEAGIDPVRKEFISVLSKGQVSQPREIAEGFELYTLVDLKPQQLVSLEERYMEIAEILRKPRAEELFEQFKKGLLDASTIVRF